MNSIGIEAVAFLPPGPYEKLEQFLRDRQWEPERAKQYATPSYLLEDVRSVITALFPYYRSIVGGETIIE